MPSVSENASLLEALRSSFPRVDGCFVPIHEEWFYIVDPPGNVPTEVISNVDNCPAEKAVRVQNPRRWEVIFTAVDHCLFDSGQGKRCDCMLFHAKEVLFLELKLEVKRRKKLRRRISEGVEQLRETIQTLDVAFEDTGNDWGGRGKAAYLFVPVTISHQMSATRQGQIRKFQEDTGAILRLVGPTTLDENAPDSEGLTLAPLRLE